MASLISIRLNDDIFHEMKKKALLLHVSQTDYIRKAIEHLNHEIEKKERRSKLQQASLRVREESMRVNAEFNEIEHDPEI